MLAMSAHHTNGTPEVHDRCDATTQTHMQAAFPADTSQPEPPRPRSNPSTQSRQHRPGLKANTRRKAKGTSQPQLSYGTGKAKKASARAAYRQQVADSTRTATPYGSNIRYQQPQSVKGCITLIICRLELSAPSQHPGNTVVCCMLCRACPARGQTCRTWRLRMNMLATTSCACMHACMYTSYNKAGARAPLCCTQDTTQATLCS